MAYEKRDLSGTLFKNDRKEQATHADMRGDVRIDGKDYWISGWWKQGRSGDFLSIALKPKDGTADRPAPPKTEQRSLNDMDEIPF